MRLASSLASTAAVPRPEKFGAFAKHLPHEWIEQALQSTGTATVRKRRLPAEQVVWLVLGMALFRDRSIVEIVDKLDLALPGAGDAPIAPSAVPQARERLGEEPMAWLFGHSAQHWAHASADRHRWRGLALYAVDGTALRVPDSVENRAHFGSAKGRTQSGYPRGAAHPPPQRSADHDRDIWTSRSRLPPRRGGPARLRARGRCPRGGAGGSARARYRERLAGLSAGQRGNQRREGRQPAIEI